MKNISGVVKCYQKQIKYFFPSRQKNTNKKLSFFWSEECQKNTLKKT